MYSIENKNKNKKLCIEIDLKKRSKAQQAAINQLLENKNLTTLINYLKSFQGSRQNYLDISKIKKIAVDKLETKEPGSVLKLFKQMHNTDKNHTPHSQHTDWVGVEIECFIPKESLITTACEACLGSGVSYYDSDQEEVPCETCQGRGTSSEYTQNTRAEESLAELFKQEKIKHASIKHDGSINSPSDCLAIEITVLTRIASTDNLKKICSLLNRLGAKVNKSCGLHVHLDARHLTQKEVVKTAKKIGRALPVLASMVPLSRRTNSYCKLQVSPLNKDRYCAVNLTAFRKYKTLEVRLHSGTTDFKKIILWVDILSTLAKSDLKRESFDIYDLSEKVRFKEETLEYMMQRISLFSPQQDCTSSTAQDNDSVEEAA